MTFLYCIKTDSVLKALNYEYESIEVDYFNSNLVNIYKKTNKVQDRCIDRVSVLVYACITGKAKSVSQHEIGHKR